MKATCFLLRHDTAKHLPGTTEYPREKKLACMLLRLMVLCSLLYRSRLPRKS